jgi:hypothetical protein
MDQYQNKSWQDLCRAAATEQDPKKLMALVAGIVKALDERGCKSDSEQLKTTEENCGDAESQPSSAVGRDSDTRCENGLSI